MMTMTDNSIMPFGEHKGKKLIDVPAGYLLWLYDQSWFNNGALRAYIVDNMDALKLGQNKYR